MYSCLQDRSLPQSTPERSLRKPPFFPLLLYSIQPPSESIARTVYSITFYVSLFHEINQGQLLVISLSQFSSKDMLPTYLKIP
jgi:hypothetical protein